MTRIIIIITIIIIINICLLQLIGELWWTVNTLVNRFIEMYLHPS